MGAIANAGLMLGVGAGAYGIDQWSKAEIRSRGPKYTHIGDIGGIRISRSENHGLVGGDHVEVARSTAPYILAGLPIVGAGFFLAGGKTALAGVGAGLLVGGGVGNIEDRATRGSVTDFLRFRPGGMNWNLADMMIGAGGVLSIVAGVRTLR